VLSGDVICDFDLNTLVAAHRERKAAVTIGLTRVANPLPFGIVIIDGETHVRRFLEKPTWARSSPTPSTTGIYVLQAKALAQVPRNEPYDFSRDLFRGCSPPAPRSTAT